VEKPTALASAVVRPNNVLAKAPGHVSIWYYKTWERGCIRTLGPIPCHYRGQQTPRVQFRVGCKQQFSSHKLAGYCLL